MPSINDVLLQLRVEGGQIVASEVDKVGDSVDGLGEKAEGTGKRSGAMMATLGRAAKVGGAAIGAFGLQSLKAGLQFNESFESARMTYSVFLGSAKKGQEFIDRLSEVSSKSPLRKTDYMEAAKQMLAFGASADQTLNTLKAVNMAVVASGKGADDMLRIVNILGQMKAQGKVSAREVNRLALAGVPIDGILKKQLGLTADQIQNIGSEGIAADKVIRAVNKGWTKQFRKSYQEAKGTLGFQWRTLVKSFEQFQREALEPLAGFLRETGLPLLNKLVGFMIDLPGPVKAATVAIAAAIGVITAASLVGLGGFAAVAIGVGAAAAVVYRFRNEIWGFLEPIVDWVTNAANNMADWVSTAARNVAGFVTALLPVKLAVLAITEYVSRLWPVWKVTWEIIKEIVAFNVRMIVARLAIAWDFIKVGWNVLKRLGAHFGFLVAIVSNLLRGKWGAAWRAAKGMVANAVDGIKELIVGLLGAVARIPGHMLAAFGGLPAKIAAASVGMFDGVKEALRSALNWVIDKLNWFLEQLRNFKVNLPKVGPLGGGSVGIPGVPGNIPALATGGMLRSPGAVLVGERGPEVLNLPKAARVTPLEKTVAPVIHTHVYLNRRQIALAVSDEIADARAAA